MADLDDERVVCLVPAASMATAWLNVYQAAGQDDGRPMLYRTVCVEVLDETSVRLVSTDTVLLLTSSVREGMAPVSPDEVAMRTIVAIDEDERAKALFKFVAKDVKAKDQPATVRLSVGSIESDTAPTLMPELARLGLSIEYAAERLVLPLFEGGFVDWRRLMTHREACATEVVSWSPWAMGRLAAMRSVDVDDITTGALTIEHAGPLGAARVTVDVWPEVTGLVMPMRLGAEVA